MAEVETLQAMLERRLIRDMTLAIAAATSKADRERQRDVLADLIAHANATIDPDRFDDTTRARLKRLGLWVWSRRATGARLRRTPPL